MLCQNCQKTEANCYFSTNINGNKTEMHLCSSCAKSMGVGFMDNMTSYFEGSFNNFFNMPSFGNEFEGLLSGMFGVKPQPTKALETGIVCPLCSSTLETISQSGKVGCAECYNVFSKALFPFIRRIHGNSSHTGRVPKSAGAAILKKNELSRLRGELKAAVEAQEFETAAKLRDEIKLLEKELNS